ncbi:hypothetical protein MRB53_041267 [Persea americana]|nr:hypothetical protein MRB53_041267 [Persea americana]
MGPSYDRSERLDSHEYRIRPKRNSESFRSAMSSCERPQTCCVISAIECVVNACNASSLINPHQAAGEVAHLPTWCLVA